MRDLRFFAPRKPIEPASDGYNWIYYYVEDISSPTMLMNYVGTIDGGYVIVDGVRISNIGSGNRKINYTFSKPGIHLLKYKESEGGGYNRFRGCSTIVEAYLCKLTGTITGPFANCSQLAKVELPNDLTELNISSVFSNCYSLSFNTKNVTTVTGSGWTGGVRVEMPNVESIPQNFCRASVGNHTLEYIDIGPNILTIGGTAFFGCTALTTIICRAEIPPTWPTGDPFYRLDTDYHIYVPYTSDHSMLNTYKTATGWSNYASRIYELCVDGSIPIIFEDPVVEQICVDNFTNNNGHVSYEDAARVRSIGNSVFATNTQITSFKELIYFTGLTSIHYSVFRACTNLSTIGIPPTVQSIGMTGPPIEHIYISNLNSFLTLTHSSYSLTQSTPNTGAHLYVNDVEVNSIVFPEGTTSIPNSCLRRIRVTSVTMPNTVTEIGAEAFGYCPLLSNVPLSTSLENLGNSCFRNCTSLTSEISFPSTLKTIGTNVYMGSNISGSVIIPEGTTSIGANAFRAVPLTGIVDLPSTMLSIGNVAFISLERKATAFIVRATTPPTLGGTNALSKIPIYVPYSSDHSILSAYQTAQYWSDYASYMSELNPDGTVPTT